MHPSYRTYSTEALPFGYQDPDKRRNKRQKRTPEKDAHAAKDLKAVYVIIRTVGD
jgi:hypothetical protein